MLVLGSSGWFGREFSALSDGLARVPQLNVAGPSSRVVVTEDEIHEFSPTVVLNFAFLTRDRVEINGIEQFTRVNKALTQRFIHVAQMPSVRFAVTVSSGASVTEPDSPYGRLKAEEEERALELIAEDRRVIVIRAYSVSGGHVRRPLAYAFSDFILQASGGSVRVEADRPVFRRYCAVADVLTVALRSGAEGRSGLFETGGGLVEMGDLAQRVVDLIKPKARLERPPLTTLDPVAYHSAGDSWRQWCSAVEVEPMDLDEQILRAAAVLIGVR